MTSTHTTTSDGATTRPDGDHYCCVISRLGRDIDPTGVRAGGPRVAVKDNIDVAGARTTAGSSLLARAAASSTDAPVVARLRRAGAHVAIKTNMHELALGATGLNPTFGDVRNPVDPSRIVGGSSSGTAAALAGGLAEWGLGTDTGGSVRVPAALTGLVGLRPTVGVYPTGGTVPLAPTRDTVGVLTKTVREAGRLHSVLAQTSAAAAIEASEVRLAVPETYFVDDLDTATTRCWEFALESLIAAGVTLVPVSAGRLAAREPTIGRAITCFEARTHLMPYLRHATGLEDDEIVAGIASPDVRALFTDSILPNGRASVSEHEYRLAMADRRALRDAFASALDASDAKALLFPTTPAVAQPLAGARSAVFETTIRNTVPGSVAGLPGITIPVPLDVTGGLPVGIALDALPGQDNEVVSMAAVLESALTQGAS